MLCLGGIRQDIKKASLILMSFLGCQGFAEMSFHGALPIPRGTLSGDTNCSSTRLAVIKGEDSVWQKAMFSPTLSVS